MHQDSVLQCFQLLVEFQFRSLEDMAKFKQIWAELAVYVAKHEPQTLVSVYGNFSSAAAAALALVGHADKCRGRCDGQPCGWQAYELLEADTKQFKVLILERYCPLTVADTVWT